MKITIEIPKDFERHFNYDRFKESITKCTYELDNIIRYDVGYNPIIWKDDIEVLEMLITELEKAIIIDNQEEQHSILQDDIRRGF